MAKGNIKYHLACPYHGDLGVFDFESDAQTAADEHLRQTHADAAGNVAPNAEVTYTSVTHRTPADVESDKGKTE